MAYRSRYFAAAEILILPPTSVIAWRVNDEAYVPASPIAGRRRRDARLRTNTQGKRYRFDEIAERDRYTCHLCRKSIDMTLSGRHPQGPTIDHLLPVSCGGGDEAHNVALAHSRCNVKRGTKGAVQLRLA
jgi:5-methylcytosine-specific restriction endonuclease McrA